MLELGGSDPFIVLDTEDLGRTVKAATMGRMQNSGQACIAAKRLIVPEDIYEPFVEGLKQAFAGFSPGDPNDPSTTLAPLSSEQAAKDLHAQIQDAIDKGATVITGGGRPEPARRVRRADDPDRRHAGDAGLLGGAVRPGRRRLQGANEDEAIELANNSTYGLGAAVFSGDLDKARSVAGRIEAGMVFVNQPTGSSPSCRSVA